MGWLYSSSDRSEPIIVGPEMFIVFSQMRHLILHSEDLYDCILNLLPILLSDLFEASKVPACLPLFATS